ncbi:MAG: hypothetical protein IMW98_07770 [Firmicutes bacterium]|nr:hypothetical protein [Bacillota bacterium]
MRFHITVLAEDAPDVLARVSAVLSRRRIEVERLVARRVAQAEGEPAVLRIRLWARGGPTTQRQLVLQLAKLIQVLDITTSATKEEAAWPSSTIPAMRIQNS